jgi:sporulation protein YlmC with PRC-barrel domain
MNYYRKTTMLNNLLNELDIVTNYGKFKGDINEIEIRIDSNTSLKITAKNTFESVNYQLVPYLDISVITEFKKSENKNSNYDRV